MNTIEEAAKRLEQLRRAGVDIHSDASLPPAPAPASRGSNASRDPAPASASQAAGVGLATEGSGSDRQSKEVALDLSAMAAEGLLVPGMERSQLEEQFRVIKRPLLENIQRSEAMRPQRANLIMVTSAVAGEGKTQTAINLALSIAMELDHTVLLVEADVVRPSLLRRVGLTETVGLMDLLQERGLGLPDVLLKSNIPKLTLLGAGKSSHRSTELLASASMNQLLDELANKYRDRVIIFDSPPLIPTTEARVLASHMGQVVMVVEAGKTPVSVVTQAFNTVKTHPVVLSVLNKAISTSSENRYGYYAA